MIKSDTSEGALAPCQHRGECHLCWLERGSDISDMTPRLRIEISEYSGYGGEVHGWQGNIPASLVEAVVFLLAANGSRKAIDLMNGLEGDE